MLSFEIGQQEGGFYSAQTDNHTDRQNYLVVRSNIDSNTTIIYNTIYLNINNSVYLRNNNTIYSSMNNAIYLSINNTIYST